MKIAVLVAFAGLATHAIADTKVVKYVPGSGWNDSSPVTTVPAGQKVIINNAGSFAYKVFSTDPFNENIGIVSVNGSPGD